MATRTKQLVRAARRAAKQAGRTAAKAAKQTGKMMTRLRKTARRRHVRRTLVRALGTTGNVLEAAGKAVVVAGAVTAAAADELR
jgi:hypothetical protein